MNPGAIILSKLNILLTKAEMNGPEYQQLYNLISTLTGLTVDENRHADIGRVVTEMLVTHGLHNVSDLVYWLAALPATHPAWRDLIRTITVGETYFFRNQAHFQTLQEDLLPKLIAQREDSGFTQLRIWSAGCASGEEPYSIAMLLEDLLPGRKNWSITILGTDINLSALERARHGVYRSSSFRSETPDDLTARWFTQTPEGFELDRRIRERVFFAPLNLVDDDYPSYDSGTMGMDLIVCRNVTIYFTEQTTRSVVRRFHAALNEGGWLIVGHAEPLASTYQEQGFVPRNFKNAVFYQKDSFATYEPPVWTLPPVSAPPTQPAPARDSAPRRESLLARTASLLSGQRLIPRRPTRSRLPRQESPPPAQDAGTAAPGEPWHQAKHAADRGNWDDALLWLGKADEQDILQPQVHYLRGLIKMQIEDLDGALHALRQAIYVEPRFALAHYTLGELYEKRHEVRLAIRHWRLARQIVEDLAPDTPLLFAEDLTADMLIGLLRHRLQQLDQNLED